MSFSSHYSRFEDNVSMFIPVISKLCAVPGWQECFIRLGIRSIGSADK